MISAKYRYYVDWSGNGNFSDANEDISAFVLEASWERGADSASPLAGRAKAGSCRMLLDNSDSRFSSYNASSPLYGLILAHRRVRVTMRIGAGSEQILWQGFLDSLIPTPGEMVSVSTAELVALGPLAHPSLKTPVSVPMHTNIRTGAAINEILDQKRSVQRGMHSITDPQKMPSGVRI